MLDCMIYIAHRKTDKIVYNIKLISHQSKTGNHKTLIGKPQNHMLTKRSVDKLISLEFVDK